MQRSRILWIVTAVMLMASGVSARLIWMQGFDWRSHQERAESMRRSTRFTTADRGRILDRRGRLLAHDLPAHSVVYTLRDIMKTRWVARRVVRILARRDPAFPFDEQRLFDSLEGIRRRCAHELGRDRPVPRQLWIRRLSRSQATALEKKLQGRRSRRDYPGLEVIHDPEGASLHVRPQELFAGEDGIRRLERLLIESGDPAHADLEPGTLYREVERRYREMRRPEVGLRRRLEELRAHRASGRDDADAELERRIESLLADPSRLQRLRQRRFEREYVLCRDLPFPVVTAMTYRPDHYPGLVIVENHRRINAGGEVLASLVGRAGVPTPKLTQTWLEHGELIVDSWYPEHGGLRRLDDQDTFAAVQPSTRHSGDLVGRSGLEAMLEDRLRPRPGARNYEVNVRGESHGPALWEQPPRPGDDVHLTLDFELCSMIYRHLAQLDPSGASVLVGDPRNGEILAWVSYPSFDPELRFRTDASFAAYQSAKPGRFLNRPVSARIPPGSIFKTVVAIGALADGVITPEHEILCRGYYSARFPDRLRCNNHSPRELDLALVEALARSCNGYFYVVGGDLLGSARLADWGRRLHLWDHEGNALEGRTWGSPPSEHTHGPMAGIGRLFTVTPIGVYRLICGIANRGLFPPARIVRTEHSPAPDRLGLDAVVWDTVIEGMRGAVDYGTARWKDVGLYRFDCAVKTGTAGTGQYRTSGDGDSRREINHAWLIGFAPVSRPQLAFVVSVEKTTEHGGEAAGPIAAAVLQWLAENRDYDLILSPAELARAHPERGREQRP